MYKYALIENNTISELVYSLPMCWRNTSNLPYAPLEMLISLGWYPIEYAQYTLNQNEKLGEVSYEILADKVIATYAILQKTQEDIEAELEQQKKLVIDTVQQHLDDKAKERGYDGILSLASYAEEGEHQFAVEGRAGKAWRKSVWDYCYQQMNEFLLGNRTMPDINIIKEPQFPVFTWGE